jgi:hypothetical protein
MHKRETADILQRYSAGLALFYSPLLRFYLHQTIAEFGAALLPVSRSRDSSVGIATGYRLDGPGSISGRERFFPLQRSDRFWDPPSPLFNSYRGFFPPGIKRPERQSDHSPRSSADIK